MPSDKPNRARSLCLIDEDSESLRKKSFNHCPLNQRPRFFRVAQTKHAKHVPFRLVIAGEEAFDTAMKLRSSSSRLRGGSGSFSGTARMRSSYLVEWLITAAKEMPSAAFGRATRARAVTTEELT